MALTMVNLTKNNIVTKMKIISRATKIITIISKVITIKLIVIFQKLSKNNFKK